MNAAPVQAGQVLAGKYRVERVLGVGGMGVVVAAMHITLDQLVALKFMLPHALQNEEAVARFLREARAAVRLKSENVARVLDVGTLEDGAPYIVMEYLDGVDLGVEVANVGHFAVPTAVDLVLQASEALAEAHSLGIIHRDLKPANLFLTRRTDGSPLVKVLDFGISKANLGNGTGDNAMTRTSALMGSPAYMSPEQMKASRDVDPRSDIWSLGVILYQLVSGRLPFDKDTVPEMCVAVLQEPIPPISTLVDDLPAGFEAALDRCLERDRERRYQNLAQVAAALAAFGSDGAVAATGRIAAVLRVPAQPAPPLSSTAVPVVGSVTTLGASVGEREEEPVPSARGLRGWMIAAAAVVVVAAGVGLLVRSRRDPSPIAPAAAPAQTAPAAAQVAAPAAPVAAAVAPLPVHLDAAPAAAPVAPAAPTPAAAATVPANDTHAKPSRKERPARSSTPTGAPGESDDSDDDGAFDSRN